MSIVLGPPRSLISLKRQTFTSGVIIRDFHLLDYALGSSVFEGSWVDRTPISYNATTGVGKILLDRFTKGKRVAAQCISLDIPAMCLDHKARFDLENLPWNKMRFSGGNIAIHAMRHKDNQTINQSRLAYTDGGPGMNNVVRKIIWKCMIEKGTIIEFTKQIQLRILQLLTWKQRSVEIKSQ